MSLSVSIDADGAGATWQCKRATCGWQDGGRVRGEGGRAHEQPPRPVRKPPAHAIEKVADWVYEWFAERKIGARTVNAFGCYDARRWFGPPIEREHPALVFPYLFGGDVANRKFRPKDLRKPQTQEPDALPTLFNVDRLGDAPAEIVWVEGEPDVMALFECGLPHTVSLKDGAGKEGDKDERRFEALRTHADLLDKAKRIVLAGDMDAPGLALREELARRLGRHRCFLVTWPAGCKDACDVLRAHGPDAVLDAYRAAEPYPIDGLQRIRIGTLRSLRLLPPPSTMTTGARATDQILKLPTEGRLIVVTGIPAHGKALALDTPVPTPRGWTTMGELKRGDEVYSLDGTITRVVEAHPVLLDRNCYRLRLADGSLFDCDGGHLWFTRTEAARRSYRNQKLKRNGREETLTGGTDQRDKMTHPRVVSTTEIYETQTTPDGPAKGRANHSIPSAKALIGGRPWPISVRPYTLGAWLGDGTSASAGLTSADPEVPQQIEIDGYEVRKNAHELAWYIHGLKGQLRDAGLLDNKHLPSDCLRAPYSDRLALLQGLMDTDGHAGADGTAEFCTTRETLALSVAELVRTMGVRTSLYAGRARIGGKDCGLKYRVCFVPNFPAFRLARKLRPATRCANPGQNGGWRKIVSVEPIASIPVRCITVEHPSGLYLVGEQFVPTHNTSWVRFVMVHTATNHGRRWAVFSPEMQPWEQFAAECAEVYSGKPFWPVTGIPSMTDADIADAEMWLSERMTMVVCDAEDEAPTLDWILERARAAVLRDGATDLLIDPWNEIDDQCGQQSETKVIGRALQRLKSFGLRHGCNVWIVAHPAKPVALKSGEKRAAPGPYDISGSQHWANKTDLGLTIHSPQPGAAEVHLWKPRHRRWGKRGSIAQLDFDELTGRYSTPITAPAEPDGPSRGHWEDAEG